MSPRQLSPLLLVCLCSSALLLYVHNLDRDVLLSTAASTSASPSVAAADFDASAAAIAVKAHPEAAAAASVTSHRGAIAQAAAAVPPAPNAAAAAAAAANSPSLPDPNAAADEAREVNSNCSPLSLSTEIDRLFKFYLTSPTPHFCRFPSSQAARRQNILKQKEVLRSPPPAFTP